MHEQEIFHDEKTETQLITNLYINSKSVCHCKITKNDQKEWFIVSWYTDPMYLHKGYGFKTMQHAVQKLCAESMPKIVKYIWNGSNSYVMDWMQRHFQPVSMLPLAVQKYSEKDTWESHIYILDTKSFLEYFGILSKTTIKKS